MKRVLVISLFSLISFLNPILFPWNTPAQADDEKLHVVTTLPFLADFVQQVGGERVQVTTLLSGMESEHTYTPKPADIRTIKEADVLVQVGLGLEIWLDGLIRNASNKKLTVITSSKGIPLLRDEAAGSNHPNDEHPHGMGNPHIWLDPERAKEMIRNITEGLIHADPRGKKIYQANQGIYLQKIDVLIDDIKGRTKTLSQRRMITHHPAWPYFAKRFGFVVEGDIQTQVGSEPSANHLASLIRTVKQKKVRVIVSEPQLNPKVPEAIARETGARVVVLTPIPGGVPGTETYLSMMKYNADQLIQALQQP
ncbi:MAG: zinc ABC transporter substrate-binding protein [Nitrospirae bacterium]|nr:zinc ABC transporter substrate-binding protein [Nitrospirota bacterium]